MAEDPVSDDFDAYMRSVSLDEEADEPPDLPPSSTGRQRSRQLTVLPVNLTNHRKAVFVIGRGHTGKSTVCRKVGEDGTLDGTIGFIAACDPGNRSLPKYLHGVKQPRTSDSKQTAEWIRAALSYLQKNNVMNAIFDMGASGDNALIEIIDNVGDLDELLRNFGVTPVILYTLGPNIDDLTSLATFQKRGFQPAATALVFNEALVRSGEDKMKAFERVRLNPAVVAARQRGAVEIWLPALDPVTMAEIERKRFLFRQAAAGDMRHDRDSLPLGPFARASTSHWLAEFEYEFAAIRTWLR